MYVLWYFGTWHDSGSMKTFDSSNLQSCVYFIKTFGLCVCSFLGIKPKALYVVGSCAATELHLPSPMTILCYHTLKHRWACEMAQQIRHFSPSLMTWVQSSGLMWLKKRINSQSLSSDIHLHIVGFIIPYPDITHTHTRRERETN